MVAGPVSFLTSILFFGGWSFPGIADATSAYPGLWLVKLAILGTKAFFFIWVMAIWVFISCFMDVFRRDDLGGGMKAVWILAMLILPFLGCLIYIITRPKVTATDVRALTMAQAASSVSTADELQKLADLKQAGIVSEQEYEQLRAKLMA